MFKSFAFAWVLSVHVVNADTGAVVASYRDVLANHDRVACELAGAAAVGALIARLSEVPGNYNVGSGCKKEFVIR